MKQTKSDKLNGTFSSSKFEARNEVSDDLSIKTRETDKQRYASTKITGKDKIRKLSQTQDNWIAMGLGFMDILKNMKLILRFRIFCQCPVAKTRTYITIMKALVSWISDAVSKSRLFKILDKVFALLKFWTWCLLSATVSRFLASVVLAHRTPVHFFGEDIIDSTIKQGLKSRYEKTRPKVTPDTEHQLN